MSEKITTASVGSDGGMNCVVDAAVLYTAGEMGFEQPDIHVGVSGGAANGAFSVASQRYKAWDIWTKALSRPGFVSIDRPGKFIDIDYMVDDVFAKQHPLDEKALRNTRTRFFLGTTHTLSRRPKYFTNDDVRKGAKPLEIIRAATSLPGMTGNPVEIQGEMYEDGVGSIEFKDSIQTALDAGADIVVAVDSRDETRRADFLRQFRTSGWTDKVVLIQPESKAWMLTSDAETLRQAFYAGCKAVRKAALENPLFQKLLRTVAGTSHRTAA